MQPNIQDVSLKSFAVDLAAFYHDVIRKNLVSTDAATNKKMLSKLRKNYSNKLRRDDPCTISFDNVEVRCAYLYYFCPSFTLAEASQFLTFLKNVSSGAVSDDSSLASSQCVEKLALQDKLTVCCLGGGPGTEVVAICAVLAEVRRRWVHQNGKPLLIDATVVDSEKGWLTIAEDVVNGLSKLVPESLVKINHFRFVQADLTKDIAEAVKEVLGRSDLVTMTKFLSAIHGPKDADSRNKILQETTSCMPVGSFLFLLDSSGWQSIRATTETIDSFAWMESVYGPHSKTSWLSKSMRKLCIKSELYGNQCCASKSTNKTSVWCKKSSTSCNGVMSQTINS